MSSEVHRPSSKSTRAPPPPPAQYILPPQSHSTCLIKDLRQVNLLKEFYPFESEKMHVQETVEILPQPVSCERIFYSYIDNHTDLRSREDIQIDADFLLPHFEYDDDDERVKFDLYSTTLYIFPKQRNEKFISEIRYIPEHITIRYKTSLELLSATFSPSEHYYENLDHFYRIVQDIFYRI